jgi:hypothetical protein
MSELQQEHLESSTIHETPPPQRTRAGRKRTVFKCPATAAWPVRGLWEAAPQEEKERAHQTCMEILEYWLGKKGKAEVARDLSVSPLRVWQLSQQALSGMMAGLLTQPRRRVSSEVFEGRPDETPAALRARVVELEKKLSRTEDLVRVLRTAPWAAPSSDATPKGGASRAAKTQRKKNANRRPRSETKSAPRDAPAHRSAAASETPLEGNSGGDG